MLFNPQNPTGHYKLKLENSTDFAVAQQLLLLDRGLVSRYVESLTLGSFFFGCVC